MNKTRVLNAITLLLLSLSLMGAAEDGNQSIRVFGARTSEEWWCIWVFNLGNEEYNVQSYEIVLRGSPGQDGLIESVFCEPVGGGLLKRGKVYRVGYAPAKSGEDGPRLLRVFSSDGSVLDIAIVIEVTSQSEGVLK